MKKSFQKIILFFLVFISLFFDFGLFYNKNEVLAIEAEPTREVPICENWQKIEIRDKYQNELIIQKERLTENLREARIGRSTDNIEYIGEEAIAALKILVEAAAKEAAAAQDLMDGVERCKVCGTASVAGECRLEACESNCKEDTNKYKCNPSWECGTCAEAGRVDCTGCSGAPPCLPGTTASCCCDWCTEKICVAQTHCKPKNPCPTGQISTALYDPENGIEAQARIIKHAAYRIIDHFVARFLPFTLYREQYGLDLLNDWKNYFEPFGWSLDGPNGLISKCDLKDPLDQASKDLCDPNCLHKYHPSIDPYLCLKPADRYTMGRLIGDTVYIKGFLYQSRELLHECVLSWADIWAALRGEKGGMYTWSCQTVFNVHAPVRSFLREKGIREPEDACYGNLYCQKKKDRGEYLKNFPCAEDYYCCF